MITVKKYGAGFCVPCKTLEKNLEGKEYEKIDVTENIEEASRLNIRNLPTTLFYKDGVIVERLVGLFPAEKFDEIVSKHS